MSTELSESDGACIKRIEKLLPELPRRFFGRSPLDETAAELPMAQFRLVNTLPVDDCGETMGHLSEQLKMKASAVTQAADRLIRQGLVERVRDAEDRRIVRLRLTDTGRLWTQKRKERRRARLEIVWRGIPPEDRVALLDALQVLDRIGANAALLLAAYDQRNLFEEDVEIKGSLA